LNFGEAMLRTDGVVRDQKENVEKKGIKKNSKDKYCTW
jgi:hypothetical protein